ncbi:olfactory receptor 1361 [Alligator mississippiensis]|nr:olfactory receptor 1361 [Alligator mississippiensis]
MKVYKVDVAHRWFLQETPEVPTYSLVMEGINETTVSEFILLGVSERRDLQPLIFAGLLATYLVNVMSNALLLGAVWIDSQLHSPMYFLLSHLAVVDVSFASITIPQALVHSLTQNQAISYSRCMAQVFLFLCTGNMEGYLLAIMAFDRYMAICNPLSYAAVVTRALCLKMVGTSCVMVTLNSLLHTTLVARLHYCSNRLAHFFCDLPTLMRLSCTRPFLNEMALFTEGVISVLSPFVFILASYALIGVSLCHQHSVSQLRKALSTCGSHLTVVLLFYGTVAWLYFRPAASFDLFRDRMMALFYTVVAPALNPLIYSLRNKEVLSAIRRAWRKVLAHGP